MNTNRGNRMKRRTTSFLSTICLALFVSVMSACSGGGGGPANPDPSPVNPATPTGMVSGTVRSAITGLGIPGVTLTVGGTVVTSAADGSYTVTVDSIERAIIRAEAAGFAENFQISRVTANQTAALDVQLLPVGVTQSLLAAVGGTVTVPGTLAQVSIPAGSLVPVAGGAAAASVNVAVTPINPALDTSVMPGDYTAVLAGGGAAVPIESFGALLIDVRDDIGTRYTLGTGKSASVRIPVGTLSATPPASIPMLVFNAATGRWTEDGVAVLEGTAPNQAYVGSVARFGYWNADQKLNTVVVSGCVRDTANQPVVNAKVKSEGINYSGTATTYTDVAGNFGVAVRRDALATLSVSFLDRDSKPVTKTVNVGPYAADFTLSPCIETVPALLQITARSLPFGSVGTPYSARLAASNGTKPYAWSFSGVLPTGLTLGNTTGQISGTPITGGTFSGTFQVQDSSAPAQTASTPFSITVITPPSFGISTLALPPGVVGTSYSAILSAANGATPYAWSILTGSLPTGLILNDTTGQISGTPSVASTFTFTIQAQDTSIPVKTASRPFTVVIDPRVLPPSAPTGVAAAPGNTLVNISWNPVAGVTSYNLYMAAVAGVTKSNYTTLAGGMKHVGVTSAYLHPGLTNGTTYYFVVTALNANGESVESIEVSATPTASTGKGFESTQVSVAVYGPSTVNRVSNILTATVGPGIEFTNTAMQASGLPGYIIAPVNIDVSGTQITLSYTSSITIGTGQFIGYIFNFSSVNPLPTITGLSLNSASNVVPTGLSFGPDSIQLNVAGLAITPQSKIVLDMNVIPVDSSEFNGVWEGSGMQNNASWTIKVSIAPGLYSIEYPSLACGGELVLLKKVTDRMEFLENLTYGLGGCINLGKTVLIKTGANSIQFEWYYPSGIKGATGSLIRK